MCWSSQRSDVVEVQDAARRGRCWRGVSSRGTRVGFTLSSTTWRSITHFSHVGARRQVVHDVEEHLFEDRPQAAGTGAAEQRLVGDRLERVVGELELDVLQLEELAVLLHQRVLRLAEDADQRLLVERRHRADARAAGR